MRDPLHVSYKVFVCFSSTLLRSELSPLMQLETRNVDHEFRILQNAGKFAQREYNIHLEEANRQAVLRISCKTRFIAR